MLIHCLSITWYKSIGFYKQEIIWKSSKTQHVKENSRNSKIIQIMKLRISNFWNVLKATLNFFFLLKLNFLEFCDSFLPDFESLYYLLQLNTSNSNKEGSSENSESKKDCSMNSSKNEWCTTRNGTSKVRNSENIEGE